MIKTQEWRRERARKAALVRNGLIAPTLADRFWSFVRKGDGCWEWQGHINAFGYGEIYVNRKHVRAHRLSWEINNGPVPGGLYVCHLCDNPKCVRPDHLFVGTHRDNMQDGKSKGRVYQPHHLPPRSANGRFAKSG